MNKTQQKMHKKKEYSLIFSKYSLWQGRRDSNTQPMVLETTTLPLSHSPKSNPLYDKFLSMSIKLLPFCKKLKFYKKIALKGCFFC